MAKRTFRLYREEKESEDTFITRNEGCYAFFVAPGFFTFLLLFLLLSDILHAAIYYSPTKAAYLLFLAFITLLFLSTWIAHTYNRKGIIANLLIFILGLTLLNCSLLGYRALYILMTSNMPKFILFCLTFFIPLILWYRLRNDLRQEKEFYNQLVVDLGKSPVYKSRIARYVGFASPIRLYDDRYTCYGKIIHYDSITEINYAVKRNYIDEITVTYTDELQSVQKIYIHHKHYILMMEYLRYMKTKHPGIQTRLTFIRGEHDMI